MNKIDEIRAALLNIQDADGIGRYGIIEVNTIIKAITPCLSNGSVDKLKEAVPKIFARDDQENDQAIDECLMLIDSLAVKIYDEIRASILTPKVVTLLKAIGARRESCKKCEQLEHALFGEPLLCNLNCIEYPDCYERCPLLAAEELKELTK